MRVKEWTPNKVDYEECQEGLGSIGRNKNWNVGRKEQLVCVTCETKINTSLNL